MSTGRPDWARLFRIASSLIHQVNSEQDIIDSWSLGGGTAMMLQIDHRESDDIDIFLPDRQLLHFLDPKLRDFEFEIFPSEYGGDGWGFLKLSFNEIGEVDFIVGQPLTREFGYRANSRGRASRPRNCRRNHHKENSLSRCEHQAARYFRYCGGGKEQPRSGR